MVAISRAGRTQSRPLRRRFTRQAGSYTTSEIQVLHHQMPMATPGHGRRRKLALTFQHFSGPEVVDENEAAAAAMKGTYHGIYSKELDTSPGE